MKQAIAWNEETEENITENGIVLNAIAYIREHYMEAVGLQDVAQCCNVSPEYLSRIFKEETGVKFVDFLANFRISMGKGCLRQEIIRWLKWQKPQDLMIRSIFRKSLKDLWNLSGRI